MIRVRTRILTVLLLAAALAAMIACQSAPLPDPATDAITPGSGETPGSTLGDASFAFPYVQVAEFDTGKLSGIVFHPQRETLFAVSDKGDIIEMEPGGTLMRTEQIRKGADFEGITWNPVTGRLYVAVEGDELILEVDPDNLHIVREIPIERMFDGQVLLDAKGNGVEGITFVPTNGNEMGGTFYLVNQSKDLDGNDPSILFEVEIAGSDGEPRASIVRYYALGVTDMSGLQYDPSRRHLLVISDSNDLLLRVSLSGQITQVHPLPGAHQEGITVDQDGFLYIAQDSNDGLLKFVDGSP